MVDSKVVNHPNNKVGLRALAQSIRTVRDALGSAAGVGQSFGGKRNLYEVFGYKEQKDLRVEDFLAKYRRQDITKRIVDAPAKATWRSGVRVTGTTELETAWDNLIKEQKILVQLARADRLSSLGHYSLLLLGFSDGGALETPINEGGGGALLYTRPICELSVTGITLNDDPTNERYGQPEMYQVQRTVPQNALAGSEWRGT